MNTNAFFLLCVVSAFSIPLMVANTVEAKPELLITELKIDPAIPYIGEGKITATIKNAGTADTGNFSTIDVKMFLNGMQCDTDVIHFGIAPGTTKTSSTESCNGGYPGGHTVKFVVDYTQEFDEADEANNIMQKQFVWTDPAVCDVPDICNGLDDNCNGVADEPFGTLGQTCDGPDFDDCANGTYVCASDGSGVICQEQSLQIELCNELDDDCDGDIDEDFPTLGQSCTAVSDGCDITGTYVCTLGGGGVVCAGDPVEYPEICNGIDEDCDGSTDEDFAHVGTTCVTGMGICRSLGVYTCGDHATYCAAPPGIPLPNELCGNREDDNCNGLFDEGCLCESGTYLPCGLKVGVCEPGLIHCDEETGGFTGKCINAILPSQELCGNHLDDDCDGGLDEGCPCEEGEWHPCAPDAGICSSGQQFCVQGEWTPCIAENVSTPEICDAFDNDCDGTIDEGCPCDPGSLSVCSVSPDNCAQYVQTCQNDGNWSACAAVAGSQVPGCGQDPDPNPNDGDTSNEPNPSDYNPYQPPPGSSDNDSNPIIIVQEDGGCSTGNDAGKTGEWLVLILLLVWWKTRISAAKQA